MRHPFELLQFDLPQDNTWKDAIEVKSCGDDEHIAMLAVPHAPPAVPALAV